MVRGSPVPLCAADFLIESERDPRPEVARRRRHVRAQRSQELGVFRERARGRRARLAAREMLVEPRGVGGFERTEQGVGREGVGPDVRVVDPVGMARHALEAAHRRASPG